MSEKKDVKTSHYTIEQAVENAGFGWFQLRLIFIAGLLMASDAMEMMLLSVLGPALRCVWFLSNNQVAGLTTAVFVGFLFGAPFWGYVSDNYGRWPTFAIVLCIICYFGLVTTITPSYSWIVTTRSIIGFAIGGASTSSALVSEYLPSNYRAKGLILFQVFWSLGSTLQVGLAYLLLPRYGFRWFIFASVIPMTICLVLIRWLPESARYLVASGKTQEAQDIVFNMNYMNTAKPLPGFLKPSPSLNDRGSIKLLFCPEFRITTIILFFVWFATAFTYYGVVLLSGVLMNSRPGCYQSASQINATVRNIDRSCCRNLIDEDYVAMIVSSLGEFVIIPYTVLTVDCIGRRVSMGLSMALMALMFGLLNICMDNIGATAVLFIIRAFASGQFGSCYTYTLECYPTTVRSLALGVFSAVARIGAMSTPYVVQVMLPEVSVMGALLFYTVVCGLSSILCALLPIETKGRGLTQNLDEVEVVYQNDEKDAIIKNLTNMLSPNNKETKYHDQEE